MIRGDTYGDIWAKWECDLWDKWEKCEILLPGGA
jgi:hypothetical protein